MNDSIMERYSKEYKEKTIFDVGSTKQRIEELEKEVARLREETVFSDKRWIASEEEIKRLSRIISEEALFRKRLRELVTRLQDSNMLNQDACRYCGLPVESNPSWHRHEGSDLCVEALKTHFKIEEIMRR